MLILLPFPPSINGYWRSFNGRQIISAKGREYRQNVKDIMALNGIKRHSGPIAVSIVLCPPDRRQRDVDNYLKAPLDALQHAGVYENDNQISDLRVTRGEIDREGGHIKVTITPPPAERSER